MENLTGRAIPVDSRLNLSIHALKTINQQLEEQKSLYNDIKEISGDAGIEMIRTWSSSLNIIKRNQTMLEQFINALGRAIIEAITLRAVMSLMDFFTGLGSSAATAVIPTAASSVSPSITSDISYSGASVLNKLATNTTYSGFSNYSAPIVSTRIVEKVVPIVLDSELSGRNLKLVQKNYDQYRKLYAGYTSD